MSTANIRARRPLLFSNASSVAVGSGWKSDVMDVSNFKSFVAIVAANSANMTVGLDQGGLGTDPLEVSSTIAHTPGTKVYSWSAVGQYAQMRITSVTSFSGALSLHVYGLPI